MLNKKLKKSWIITIVCAALMIIAIWLPYITFTEEAGRIYSDIEGSESFSLVKMGGVDSDLQKIVMIYLGLAVVALIMGILKKAIGAIIFSVVGMGWLTLLNMTTSSADMTYAKFGLANYVIYIAGVGVIVGAIMMIKAKRAIKKESVQ